jgi:hypothetical protein
VFDIPPGLADLGGNFIERIAFHKVQTEGLALILRQFRKYLLHASVSESSVDVILKAQQLVFARLRAGVSRRRGPVVCKNDEKSNSGGAR